MDACRLETAASCHLTGGVWASLPIYAFRNSIICSFWGQTRLRFLAGDHVTVSAQNNKKGGYLRQQTGVSSCSLARNPLLLYDFF